MSSDQLKVIGAGYGRTATGSLRIALELLGYKCYHMHDNFKYEDDYLWCDIFDDKKDKKPDLRLNERIFEPRGYSATVDWPSTYYYKEIFAENPSAKVVLTVRDSGKQWHKSIMNSIYPLSFESDCWQFNLFSRLQRYRNRMSSDIWNAEFDHLAHDEKHAIQCYRKHIENVIECIPSEQLLVFNVKQGWKPLCDFLNKEIPRVEGGGSDAECVPFPRGNTTVDKKLLIRNVRRKKNFVSFMCMLAVAVLAAVVLRIYVFFQ